MSDFHYVRTLGKDGGVDVCDGPAIGIDLAAVLDDGLPPWSIALEVIAAMCEILDIAQEDGEEHGQIGPDVVFLDETGAVSIEGFGIERAKSNAPEGKPRGSATDLYGLGRVAFAMVSSKPLPEVPDDDADAHDDAIIEAILGIDLSGLPDEIQGDVQWFFAKLLSFDREDRPTAVEAWRSFIAFASAVSGPEIGAWSDKAIDGAGERRKPTESAAPAARQAAAPEEEEEDEDLGGPVKQSGPLSGGLSFKDQGAKGAATAFWSKADMKAALEKEDDEARPAAGGGQATGFWSVDQLAAMAAGNSAAPRPKRATGEGERRKTSTSAPRPRRSARHPSLRRRPRAIAPSAVPLLRLRRSRLRAPAWACTSPSW